MASPSNFIVELYFFILAHLRFVQFSTLSAYDINLPHMGQQSILITDYADSIEPIGINAAFTVGNDNPVGNDVR